MSCNSCLALTGGHLLRFITPLTFEGVTQPASLNTLRFGERRGPSKQLSPVRGAVKKDRGTVACPLIEVRNFPAAVTWPFLPRVIFLKRCSFPTISNTAEMNVRGNCLKRGRALSSSAACHSQSRPCVSSSRRVTCLIKRQSWAARETAAACYPPSPVCVVCWKGLVVFL